MKRPDSERIQRELESAGWAFLEEFGREPDPSSEKDMDWMWDSLAPEVRKEYERLAGVREIESAFHKMILEGRVEISGVDERGNPTYRAKDPNEGGAS